MHMYNYEAIHKSNIMIAEMRKSSLRNTYTENGKIKINQQKVKRNFFILKIHYSSEQKNVNT